MTSGTRAVDDGERGRPASWVSDVIAVVRAIEVLPVPAPAIRSDPHFFAKIRLVRGLQWEDNVRSDTSKAWLLGEVVGIPLGVEAWRIHAASKVGF